MAHTRSSQGRRKRGRNDLGDSWVVSSNDEPESEDLSLSEDLSSSEGIASGAGKRLTCSTRKRLLPSASERSHRQVSELKMPTIEHEVRERGSRRKQQDGRPAQTKKKIRSRPSSASRTILDFLSKVLYEYLSYLQKPLGFLLMIATISVAVLVVYNQLTQTISTALSPVCAFPFVRSTLFCARLRARVSPDNGPDGPAQFNELFDVQTKFEELLQQSSAGVALPLQMKRGETSIRDVRSLVKYSDLRSKQELLLELDGFIDTARIASYDLTRFNSHVGRAIDFVLANARWTQKDLEGIAANEASRSQLARFVPRIFGGPKAAEAEVFDRYTAHTNVVSEQIHVLLDEAQTLLQVLNNLEDRIDTMGGICRHDEVKIEAAKDELMASIWTKFGGNSVPKGKFQRQLQLLEAVTKTRHEALAHVMATVAKLQVMDAELEQMKQRMGETDYVIKGGRGSLQAHLEAIQLGVERMQIGREYSRKIEKDFQRSHLDVEPHIGPLPLGQRLLDR